MEQLHLSNEHVALSLVPEFGARVTELTDRKSGRNWLVAGAATESADDDAVFGGREACGWDECFPTVAPCHNETYGRVLRDHGDLWGRPWSCRKAENTIHAHFAGSGWQFSRDITLIENRVVVDYAVSNQGRVALPYLWSQHCLLATSPSDRIALDGIGPMTVTGGVAGGQAVPCGTFEWPELSSLVPDLTRIRDMSTRFAIKAYAPVRNKLSAAIEGTDGSIRFSWTDQDAPVLGLWLDYGGWPQSDPVHQIAFEPTTAVADHLAGAFDNNSARWLAPDETHSWTTTLTLSPTDRRNGDRNVE